MSRYSEALGIAEFNVGGLDFEIRPKKGDNRKLLKLQSKSGEDHAKLMEEFVPYMVDLIAREDDLAKEDQGDLETFIEQHMMDFFKEVMIAFNWTTREKMEKAEQEQMEKAGFPSAKSAA